MYMRECACTRLWCVCMSMHAFHVCACFYKGAYWYIRMWMYIHVHVSTFCVYAYVYLSVYTQIRGWETSSQVNPSTSWSKSPVKVRVTQRGLRWDFGELVLPGSGGRGLPSCSCLSPWPPADINNRSANSKCK